MKQEEKNWIWRITQNMSAKGVKNPADIKEKLKFYGEQEELSKLSVDALMCVIDGSNTPKTKEEEVKYLEHRYKEIYKHR